MPGNISSAGPTPPRQGWRLLAIVVAVSWLAVGALSAQPAELRVLAAASLADALKAIGRDYTEETGVKVTFNFAASSLLARQIIEGAPGDVFLSADERSMDMVDAKELIDHGSRVNLLGNSLVIIGNRDADVRVGSIAELTQPSVKRIAMGDPANVPAGVYARRYLEQAGIWSKVQAKTVAAANVRGALFAVESGDVDAGIVYRSDAVISTKVRVLCEIAPLKDDPILYPGAILTAAKDKKSAVNFLEHLQKRPATEVFERFGFKHVEHVAP